MAFGKWRLSRGRKGSNSSAEQDANTSGSTTPVDSSGEGQNLPKPRSHEPSQGSILRSLTGTFKPTRPRKLTEKDAEYARLHKPFTKQNLEHQKILSAFEWNFGTNRGGDREVMSICSGISPCTSRQGSVDHDHLYPPSSRTDTRRRVSSVLSNEVPFEHLSLSSKGAEAASAPRVARMEAVC